MASILLAFNVYQQHLMIVNTTQIKRTGKNGIIELMFCHKTPVRGCFALQK